MAQTDSKNYQNWFRKGDEDELSALSMLKHRDASPSTVCFLSQQIAEKYLKAFLVFQKIAFRKTHDLLELETLILPLEKDVKHYEKEMDTLTTYYFETRYPADYPEFSWNDAEEAYAAAKKIKEFVLSKIK